MSGVFEMHSDSSTLPHKQRFQTAIDGGVEIADEVEISIPISLEIYSNDRWYSQEMCSSHCAGSSPESSWLMARSVLPSYGSSVTPLRNSCLKSERDFVRSLFPRMSIAKSGS
jgi:hypothetical protein